MQKELRLSYDVQAWQDLTQTDRELIEQAQKAGKNSYAPYSNFHVGCALRLADGQVISGNNQENASYPCGTCAERTALSYAHAQYPNIEVTEIAIAAETGGQFTEHPLPPCGLCRQALLEVENNQQQKIRILMYGKEDVLIIPSASSLLPFQFDAQSMQ